MNKKVIYLSFFAAVISIIFCSYKNGPGLNGYDCTGAETNNNEGNPTGCSSGNAGNCHNTLATPAITVALELDSVGIAVTNYVGGQTYTVKLSGVNTGSALQPDFGFQIACIKGTIAPTAATDAGTWRTPPANTHIAPPFPIPSSSSFYTTLHIFEHSEALTATTGSGGNGTTYVESISWTAPAAGTGAISFWAALNTINSGDVPTDTNSINDLWDTVKMIIKEEAPGVNGIDAVSQNNAIKVFPNPVNDIVNLQWENAEAGTYIISVYNLEGQNIASQNMNMNGGAVSEKINTSGWAPGIYLVSVKKDETRNVFRIVKQ